MSGTLAPAGRPVLWRLARLDYDDVRGRPIVQYPEGALLLNESGREVLELCDGVRTVNAIAAELSARYGTDVEGDVREFLDGLFARHLVFDAGGAATP